MKSAWKLLAIPLVLAAVARGDGGEPRTNLWRVQIGWVHQWDRHTRVEGPAPSIAGGALAGRLPDGLQILPGTPALTYPDNSLFILREFDGGCFVGPDVWTGDEALLNSSDPLEQQRYGMTWNWSAGAANYDYDGGQNPTFTFTRTDGVMADGAPTVSAPYLDDDLPTDGVELKVSRRLHTWTNSGLRVDCSGLTWTNGVAALDLVAGVAWFPTDRPRFRQSAEQSLYLVSETYTYADFYGSQAGGSWWDLTSILPYTGTVNGPGPLIPARPDSATLDTTLLGTARDDVRIDCRLWRLRGELGVTLSKDVTKRLSAYVSPQFALEYVDMRATRIETLSYTDARTQETVMLASDTQNRRRAMFIPGFLLTGGLDYLLSEHWYAGASVGWEWLARDPSIRIGPNKIRYHLDGGEFSLYVGRYF